MSNTGSSRRAVPGHSSNCLRAARAKDGRRGAMRPASAIGRRGKPMRIILQRAGSSLRSSAGFVPLPYVALWRGGPPRKGEVKRLAVVRLALLAEGILAGLGLLPGQRERRERGAAFLLLVPLRLRLLLFLGASHLTLGHVVPPVLACPRARTVEGLKRRGRTDSSGVSRPRNSVVAGILCGSPASA